MRHVAIPALALAAWAMAGCSDERPEGGPVPAVEKAQQGKKEPQMSARENLVTMKGKPLTLVGNAVQVGDAAPDATLAANDLSEVKLSSFRGKVVLLATVPSLDTGVCSIETRRFNQEAAALGDNVVVLTVSMDMPFAQKRWCGAEGVQRVVTLSDHRDASLGLAFGVLIKELRLLARAVFVIDPQGRITYMELVPEMGHEPNYEAALQAVQALTRGK
jgi:thiol peroxidase